MPAGFVAVVSNVDPLLLCNDQDHDGTREMRCTSENRDGTFQGRPCDPAVFDYYLEVVCPGGDEYFKKGNVTIIR